jgi:hypothetical protein
LVVAPYLAGAGILLVLDLPLDRLAFGLAYAYWKALDLPAFVPFATRIQWAGGLGLMFAPVAWAGGMLFGWRRARMLTPLRRSPEFLTPAEMPRDGTWRRAGNPVLTTHRYRRLRLPAGESLLLAAPDYPATYGVLRAAVRDSTGPVLVIDLDGAMYRGTAGWRASKGGAIRIAPFGGGAPWNPLAAAWNRDGLCRDALDALAACWYPERERKDRVLVSHVRSVFGALVEAVDDVLREAGDVVPPAPGDLWRLLAPGSGRLDRRFLTALANLPSLGAATRKALVACVALDDDTLARTSERLRGPLACFARPDIDAGSRGFGLSSASPSQTAVYLHLPYARRQEAIPIVESFVAQWRETVRHDDALVVIHGLDLLPPLPFLQHAGDGFRCFASTRSLAALFKAYGHADRALMHRFGVLAVHAPGERLHAEREAGALARYVAFRDAHTGTSCAKPLPTEKLLLLRDGEQFIFAPLLTRPVRCRVIGTHRRAPAPPSDIQGEPMPFPKPLAALLTALIAGCSAPAQKPLAQLPPYPCGPRDNYDDPERIEEVNLGPHRFCLPAKLFNGPHQPWSNGTELGFVLDWPSLEPLPRGFDMYKDNDRFLAILGIEVSYPHLLSDEQFRVFPRRWIEPIDPTDPAQLADPADNLELRIKGDPVHGLTPYYTDFDRLLRYHEKAYGPNPPGVEPENSMNDDWFIDMGPDGIPRTVLKCSPKAVPDGVRMEGDRMVSIPEVFRRATCSHRFVIPEYRATVDLLYQRMVMPDWRRIETRIRSLLHDSEINR